MIFDGSVFCRRSITTLLLFSFVLHGYAQDDFDSFRQEQLDAMQNMSEENTSYSDAVSQEFDAYYDEQNRLFELYQAEIEDKWDEFKASSSHIYVDYDEDFKSRTSVDFENGEINIEVLVDDDPGKGSQQKQQTAESLVEKRVARLLKQKAEDRQQLLKDQVRNRSGTKVTQKSSQQYAKEVVEHIPLSKEKIVAGDGQSRVKYSVKIKMIPNHIEIRAKRFKADILKQAERFNIDPAVAFAVMQTESYFNPNARSHVPAYGLMQLVPKSGARDAYRYIYKQDKLLKDTYLYNPKNNIELGCAYLGKLRHVYFKDIQNNQAAYYCTISAYNTGPGNVAKAFTGGTKLGPTAKAVNSLAPDQVYRNLLNNLPYKETKDYLAKVNSRVENYQAWK
jgi:membrane-bound lytic murein transglycosylase C